MRVVVLVTANRGWRLTVRGHGEELVVEGGVGRDQRRVLPARLASTRREGALEISLVRD